MADNAGNAADMARILANVHIIVGFILFCFGVADRAIQNTETGFGIWMGVWVSCAWVYFNAARAIFNSKRLSIFKPTKRLIVNVTRVQALNRNVLAWLAQR